MRACAYKNKIYSTTAIQKDELGKPHTKNVYCLYVRTSVYFLSLLSDLMFGMFIFSSPIIGPCVVDSPCFFLFLIKFITWFLCSFLFLATIGLARRRLVTRNYCCRKCYDQASKVSIQFNFNSIYYLNLQFGESVCNYRFNISTLDMPIKVGKNDEE